MSDLTPMERRLVVVLTLLNPRLNGEVIERYAKTVNAEAMGKRLPTARRVFSEALRWKPPAQTVGGHSAGPKKVSDLDPPPTGPGVGA